CRSLLRAGTCSRAIVALSFDGMISRQRPTPSSNRPASLLLVQSRGALQRASATKAQRKVRRAPADYTGHGRRMMDASLITLGADAPNAAVTLNRVALGTFFAISGYLKLFNASRHETLARTLRDDGVRAVPIMQWVVPGVELSGGCALVVG